MKKIKLLLYLIFVLPSSLLSQYETHPLPSFSWQFSFGMGKTFHHYAPIAINTSPFTRFFFTRTTHQSPVENFHFNLILNQKLSNNQELSIGVGINSLNFRSFYDTPTSPFLISADIINLHYGFQVGHQFYFRKRKDSSLFIGNSLFRDKTVESSPVSFFESSGFSYQVKFGLKLKYLHKVRKKKPRRIRRQLNKVSDMFFDVFYKTAITPYNKIKYDKHYFPYYWGVEMGYVFKIKKR